MSRDEYRRMKADADLGRAIKVGTRTALRTHAAVCRKGEMNGHSGAAAFTSGASEFGGIKSVSEMIGREAAIAVHDDDTNSRSA